MRFTQLTAVGVLASFAGLAAMAAPAAPPKPAAKPAPAAPAAPAGDKSNATGPAAEFFEKEVRPVLAEQCYSCHGPKVHQANLRLDGLAYILRGGDRGPALVPGTPEKSLIVQAIKHQGMEMPPGRKLAERQVAALERWVKMGAPWPGGAAVAAPAARTWPEILAARRQWWSLDPVKNPAVPKVRNKAWSKDPIDLFLLSALEKKGLQPAPVADRRTLIRRATLLLTGLPPTAEQVEAFVKDPAPNAYEQLVDRLIASPQYGERFARHWMDVVRFGETHGYEWNYEVRDAWRYRDYLIRAFNQDVPYDQFIREHIAGDLMPKPRLNEKEGINESVIATAFFRFGENGHDVFKEIGLDVLDNQIDTLSKSFQATTVSCARCHDHKLDAISTRDYYGLLGILVSSRQVANTLDADSVNAARKQKLVGLKSQIHAELSNVWAREGQQSGAYLRAAQAARDNKPDAAALASGLDPARLKAWTAALEKKPGALEDPLHPWTAVAGSADVAQTWSKLAEQYTQEAKARAASNAKNFTDFGDFRTGTPVGWRVDGLGLRGGPSKSGDFAVACEGDQAVSGVFPAGYFTHSISERLNGSIQSPWWPQNKRFVSLKIMGGRNGVLRDIPDHRQLTDSGRELKPELGWVTLGRSQRDEWDYLELITKFHNPRYTGDENDPRSFFGITQAVFSDNGGAPQDELSSLQRLFPGTPVKSVDDVAAQYTTAIEHALSAWGHGAATDDDVRWVDWMMRQGLVSNSLKQTPRLTDLVSQYRAVEKELAPARIVAGVADQDQGFDVPVYNRGDFRTPGDMAPRHYLEVISGSAEGAHTGSGRTEVADRITDPRNPLTARVMANRIWYWMFGTGIVRTPDDFGHMGEPPSHPELLDFLATKLMNEGWSIKRMVRAVALTQAFKMSSKASELGKEVEPENRLLHHYPARRLEAEAIRDSILEVSGRLDPTLYGPSIQPYRDDPKPERRLFGGPLDGNGRRSVYTKITLMGGPKFLEVFNFPDPKTAQGRRDVTNVPAQALTLLNDPFIANQADFWAGRLVANSDTTIGARVEQMFLTALGRAPQKAEAERLEQAIREIATLQNVPEAEIMKSRAVWKDVAHAVFNLKEFIYVR